MIDLLASPIVRWLGVAFAVLGMAGYIYIKGREAGEAKIEAAVAAANKMAEAKATALSTDLLIEQVKAMGATAKKASTSVQQIHAASTDADRMRAGSRGVRDLIRGEGGPAK